jgi:hypothetical protein
MEEYNQQLEKQLSTIFSSISASVQKAERSGKSGSQKTGELGHVMREEHFLESEQEYERVNSSLIHNFNSSEKHTRSSRQVNPDHQSFKTQVGHLSDIEYSSGLNHTPTPELDNTGEVEQENMKNEEKEEESHVYEIKKQTILLLKEDEIKPIAPSYKHFHEKSRRCKSTGGKNQF